MSVNLWQGHWRGRVPDGVAHKRSREIVRHTGGIVRGKFPSRKTGRMLHHEGLLELDAIYHFETSPKILRYTEQPEQLHYPDGAKLRRYTPDFELVLESGEIILVEVKPSYFYQKEEVKHKLDRVGEHLDRLEKRFVVLTEHALRLEPRLASLRWLYHQLPRISPTYEAMEICLERYRANFPLPFKETVSLFSAHNIHPCSLLVAGLLICPLEQPINFDTPLQLYEENGDGWFFIEKTFGF